MAEGIRLHLLDHAGVFPGIPVDIALNLGLHDGAQDGRIEGIQLPGSRPMVRSVPFIATVLLLVPP